MQFTLAYMVERLAMYSVPRHRELARGMVAELANINDPGARTRFALGAAFAIIRLRMRDTRLFATQPSHATNTGGAVMIPIPTSGRIVRRHIAPFLLTLTIITGAMLANSFTRRPDLAASGEVMLLTLPFTLAMTVPTALFLTVLWVFTRLGRDGVLAAAELGKHGTRRLVAPVAVAAVMVGAMMAVLNTQVLPGANARLATVLQGKPARASDRSMTVSELHSAARAAREEPGAMGEARAVAFEVEIQKKFAIAAACIVLALVGAAIPLRFPRAGYRAMFVAGVLIIPGYYFALIAGETLADRQMVSAFVAMWTANTLLLILALLLLRRRNVVSDGQAA